MTLKKHSKCEQVVVSNYLYRCPSCQHADISNKMEDKKICPKCDAAMELVSCSTDQK